MSPQDALTDALPRALRELLTNPRFRVAAAETAQLYAGVDGAARAADAIVDSLGLRRDVGERPAS